MAHGSRGTLIYANGNYYTGAFKRNIFHGKGLFSYFDELDEYGKSTGQVGDKRKYEGDWVDGKKEGEGTERYQGLKTITKVDSDGEQIVKEYGKAYYIGQFKNNLPHGKGTFYYDDKNIIFNGMIKRGKAHGQGNLFINYEDVQWVF